MNLHVDWQKSISLNNDSSLTFEIDLNKVPQDAGIYIFGRQWGNNFEALYVGKAIKLRSRLKSQLNNLRLMKHVNNAKNGKRVLLIGAFNKRPGQQTAKCIMLIERAMIRHFLSEGHDLSNIQGTSIRRHELVSSGLVPKKVIPKTLWLEKRRGE